MTHKCKECGAEEDPSRWMKSTGDLLAAQKLCLACYHWEDLIQRYSADERIVVEGKHYIAGKENGPTSFRGFGGRHFTIEFFDGRKLETTNLWHQGTIPEHYRGRLPDNAKWGGK